jgi:antitoxin ParD1/3/4
MAKNTSISLGEHFTTFIDQQVESGRYSSASDVLRAGLRLLQDQESKLEALRKALQEGLDSGEPEPFDFDEFLARKNAALNKDA